MTEALPPYVMVETDAGLAEAAQRWMAAPAIAVDTEFVRTRTFFQQLGLIQVADGQGAWLIDPLAVRDLAPLKNVFRSPGTVKVLHSASEDMEVFYRVLGALPEPLFDTQVAAALAGSGPFLSYQKLVAAFLGIELSKEETRTDWLARPLSSAQLTYAAEDVVYLVTVYERLAAELSALGRLAWAFEDSSALLDTSRFEEDLEMAYLRVKGAGRLDRRQLGALKLLAAWREGEARGRDLPRSFVVKDDLLLGLATRRPKNARDLQKIPAYDPRQGARDAATWLELLERAEELPESQLPPRIERPFFPPAVRELEDRLREKVREKAAALNLPPEILTPRRSLDALLRLTIGKTDPRLPRELLGWRREAIGEELLREVLGASGAAGTEAGYH